MPLWQIVSKQQALIVYGLPKGKSFIQMWINHGEAFQWEDQNIKKKENFAMDV